MNDKTQKSKKGQVMTGKVMSVKMAKTVIVGVTETRKDPLYGKRIRRVHRFAAHNELKDIKEGDMVKIRETRPVSKTKHFIVEGKVEG